MRQRTEHAMQKLVTVIKITCAARSGSTY